MNTKIDETNDFEFGGMTFQDGKEQATSDEKLKKILAIVEPLLENLAKDPDKTTIKWDNRVEIITKMRARITQIMAS